MAAVFVTRLTDCAEFLAGDHTHLRELLHPGKTSAQVRYSLAYGRLDPGRRSKRHRLASSEVYYFLSGTGTFAIGEETAPVSAGSVVYVPPRATQWVDNTGGGALEFLCLVDPAWREQDEDVLE